VEANDEVQKGKMRDMFS